VPHLPLLDVCSNRGAKREMGGTDLKWGGGHHPKQSSKPPPIETWNTINRLSFCQFLECQAPAQTQSPTTETQSPPIENFLATVLVLMMVAVTIPMNHTHLKLFKASRNHHNDLQAYYRPHLAKDCARKSVKTFIGKIAVFHIRGCLHWLYSAIRSEVMADNNPKSHYSGFWGPLRTEAT